MPTTSTIPRCVLGFAASLAALLGTARAEDDERTIRGLDEAWSRALEAGELDGAMACYAEDAVHAAAERASRRREAGDPRAFARRMEMPGYHAKLRHHARHGVSVARDGVGDRRVQGEDGRQRGTRRARGEAPRDLGEARRHLRVTAESLNFDAP
jgi:hypothetical protein